ncbi:uncharacterized protein LOC122611618 isoform X1 [Drosophila teissieri]|uniref:uncharacterized protein LOC122611618 isoform X1 n=1 Tax=Drosophila teissieri TaxID=7243 RepID=UPI001CBA2C6B|nr:uncharacterized protein LOC122611618 isoform X1 [Drosophila teissieri]
MKHYGEMNCVRQDKAPLTLQIRPRLCSCQRSAAVALLESGDQSQQSQHADTDHKSSEPRSQSQSRAATADPNTTTAILKYGAVLPLLPLCRLADLPLAAGLACLEEGLQLYK